MSFWMMAALAGFALLMWAVTVTAAFSLALAKGRDIEIARAWAIGAFLFPPFVIVMTFIPAYKGRALPTFPLTLTIAAWVASLAPVVAFSGAIMIASWMTGGSWGGVPTCGSEAVRAVFAESAISSPAGRQYGIQVTAMQDVTEISADGEERRCSAIVQLADSAILTMTFRIESRGGAFRVTDVRPVF